VIIKMFAVATLLIAVAFAAPAEDLVKFIPQVPEQPDFKIYSGYLDIPGTTKSLHYLFVESANDPATDPLALWLTGGPGCSSMMAYMYEHGPWYYPPKTTTLVENPWSWNKVANMIYLEAPAGVGFSLVGEDKSGWTTDDKITAKENL
jgi:cathepsin A (carboxypeptidase C)